VLWEEISIGDIVQLSDNDTIPCDMVILSTSQEQNQCYVQTSNLDGETSLKTKVASPLTKNLKSIDKLNQFLGCVQCENPNSKIDNFVGNMVSFDNNKSSNNKIEYMEKVSLSPDNILLTGTQLKNTANVFGLCVYAGKETKIHLNSKMTYNKFSSIEHSLVHSTL